MKTKPEPPYIIKKKRIVIVEVREYNPKYGDERICKCGHNYERHFDTYENMSPIGCKYCQCRTFVELQAGDIPHDFSHYDAYDQEG